MSRSRIVGATAVVLFAIGAAVAAVAGVGLIVGDEPFLGLAVLGLLAAVAGVGLVLGLLVLKARASLRVATSSREYARHAAVRTERLLAREPIEVTDLMAKGGPIVTALDIGRVELHALSEEMLLTAVRTRSQVAEIGSRVDGLAEALAEASSRELVIDVLDAWFQRDAVRDVQRETAVEAVRAELRRSTADAGDLARLVRREATGLYGLIEGLEQIHKSAVLTAPLPPLGGWVIRADLGAFLVRHVLRAAPEHIVDLGSGVSTVLLAAACRTRGAGHVFSFDHEEFYAAQTRKLLVEHGLEAWGSVTTVPLSAIQLDGESYQWYELPMSELPDRIDLLLVDGPPAGLGPMARYPAVPVLGDRLSPGATVILDDAHRPDEREVAKRWAELLGCDTVTELGHLVGTAMLLVPDSP